MSHKGIKTNNKIFIGNSEWCSLPQLNIPAIKAKVDTGAQTSALHAFNILPVTKNSKQFVEFDAHPIQRNNKVIVRCCAEVIDMRYIMSSNGHKEHRYVISTPLKLNGQEWDIELTLSNRDPLRYRMLLGRQALDHRVMIDPGNAYHLGKRTNKSVLSLYNTPIAHKNNNR